MGQAGELFALDAEHRRLWEAGEPRLAGRIERAARVRGDGRGYDIASFEVGGRERLIEVKTTNFAIVSIACSSFAIPRRSSRSPDP